MRPPNIVVIVPDDLGWSDAGGNPHTGGPAFTPHIGGLLSRGLFLGRLYAHSLCSPTRCALHTGRYPFRQGMSKLLLPWSVNGIPASEVTLPEALASSGYRTAACGKWHLGHAKRRMLPFRRGYSHFYGCYTGWVDPFTRRNRGVHDWVRNGVAVHEDGHVTDLIAQEAVGLISTHDFTRPLFLYLPFTAPHTPLGASRHLGLYRRRPENEALYLAMITTLDEAVGAVLDALHRAGQADSTYTLFMADNGVALGNGGSTPFRAGKGQPYDGGVRVPASIAGPGLPAGRWDGLCYAADWFPTLLSLAGLPQAAKRPLDGADLSVRLREGGGPGREEVVIDVGNGRQDGLVFGGGRWKYLGGGALYDLRADPLEEKDVAAECPAEASFARLRMKELRGQVLPSPRRPNEMEGPAPERWGAAPRHTML